MTQPHTKQAAALVALLDDDAESASAILQYLASQENGIMDLQALAHAAQTLAVMCRDAALASIWPDGGDFPRKSPRLGARDEQRKDSER